MQTSRLFLIITIAFAWLIASVVGVAGQTDPAAARAALPSAGCGSAAVAAGRTRGSMDLDALVRSWHVNVPPAHDGAKPVPLVLLLHGYTQDGLGILLDSGVGALGDEVGYVTVAPEGRGQLQRWIFELDSAPMDISAANPDIAFISALLDRLGDELCLDLARVYAAGFSNGALATAAVGCALSDRIAAIAEVAGPFDFGTRCTLERPVPFIGFHGTEDSALPMEGGLGPGVATTPTDVGVPFTETPMAADPVWAGSMSDRVAAIASRNGCSPEPVSTSVSKHVHTETWPCPRDADVEFVVVDGDGHSWPGTSDATMEIAATPMIWEFFEQHARG
jgi:polyhydroxybutyrate depolymerase